MTWNKCTIGDLCDSVSITYRGNAKKVVLINTSDVFDGKILNHDFVANEGLKGQFKKTFAENDILYSEIRPANRRFAFVDFCGTKNYIASTKLMVIRPRTDKVRPRFLYAILTAQTVIDELQHLAETRSGTFPQITFNGEVAPIPVRLPSFEAQDAIVSIIDSIDGKIDENRKINHNLQQQAFALFDHLFPNISDGLCTIGDYITPKRGRNLLSKDAVPGTVPVVAGGLEPSTYHNTANTLAPVLTISASGANAGFVNLWHTPVWSSDSSFIDSSMTEDVYFWFVMLKKRQREIFDAQTGSAQPHIYPQHIAAMTIRSLDKALMSDFASQVTPLFALIGANKDENDRLASVRDALLPKLMSGEIDVSEVEL